MSSKAIILILAGLVVITASAYVLQRNDIQIGKFFAANPCDTNPSLCRHMACIPNACVEMDCPDGDGACSDECSSDNECIVQVTPTETPPEECVPRAITCNGPALIQTYENCFADFIQDCTPGVCTDPDGNGGQDASCEGGFGVCTPTNRTCSGNDVVQHYSESTCPDTVIETCSSGCFVGACLESTPTPTPLATCNALW